MKTPHNYNYAVHSVDNAVLVLDKFHSHVINNTLIGWDKLDIANVSPQLYISTSLYVYE